MLVKELKFKNGTIYKNIMAEDSAEFTGFIRVVFPHGVKDYKAGSIVLFNKRIIDHIILN